ncbi:MAG: hypothetical protein OEY28_02620 [Nitrospira sp.]|nr:hypothetical protein [Nitrospira sp.]
MRTILMMAWGMIAVAAAGWAAEPVTPIASLLANPNAVHRKVFKLEGTAKNVAVFSGSEARTNQPLCGADFDLEDESGSLLVLYHVRCQSGKHKAFTVGDGMRVVIDGYMEAPPTVQRYADGKDFGVKFMAQSVTKSTQ